MTEPRRRSILRLVVLVLNKSPSSGQIEIEFPDGKCIFSPGTLFQQPLSAESSLLVEVAGEGDEGFLCAPAALREQAFDFLGDLSERSERAREKDFLVVFTNSIRHLCELCASARNRFENFAVVLDSTLATSAVKKASFSGILRRI